MGYKPDNQTLRAAKGVVRDVSLDDIRPDMALESLNGRIMPVRDGDSFQWVTVRGEKAVPLNGWTAAITILGFTSLGNRIYVLGYDTGTDDGVIGILDPVYSADGAISQLNVTEAGRDVGNTNLQFNPATFIRKVRVNRDTLEIVTVYWNDKTNSLRGLRIKNDAVISFNNMDFSGKITYPDIQFTGLVDGSLPSWNNYYACRMKGKNGSVSDWSMVKGPVQIPNKRPVTGTQDEYNSIYYETEGNTTSVGVKLHIENLDTNFDTIQVVAIKSSTDGAFTEAYIFTEQPITGPTIDVQHLGETVLGLVDVADLPISSQALLGCQDFDIIKNLMTVIGPKVQGDLTTTTTLKNDRIIGVTSVVNSHSIPFDTKDKTQYVFGDNATGAEIPIGITLSSNLVLATRSKYYNRVSLANETETITSDGEYPGYKGAMASTLLKSAWRGETLRIGFVPVDNYGKRLGARYLCDVTIPSRYDSPLVTFSTTQYLANVLSVQVSNIDISDWVTTDGSGNPIACEIQGFHLVVAPVDQTILSEGLLMCTGSYYDLSNTLKSSYGLIIGNSAENYTANTQFKPLQTKNLYAYYSPDVQNGLLAKYKDLGFLRIEDQLQGMYTENLPSSDSNVPVAYDASVFNAGGGVNFHGAQDSYGSWNWAWDVFDSKEGLRVFQKYYDQVSNYAASYLQAVATENSVVSYYDVPELNPTAPHDTQKIYITELGNKEYINGAWGCVSMQGTSNNKDFFGAGAACRLFVTQNTEPAGIVENPFANLNSDGVTIVSHRRNNSQPYGGTTDAAIEATQYRSTWHYQPVDLTILGQIKDANGKFIFDNVEFFPGEAFLVPYSLDRVFHGINTEAGFDTQGDYYYSHASIIPLQSRTNSTMNKGETWLKNRSLRTYGDYTNGPVDFYGIGAHKFAITDSYIRLQNFKYPGYANSGYGNNLYFTLPASIFYTTEFPMRYFWSLRKVDGEEEDSFRQFPYANYKSAPGQYGLPKTINTVRNYSIIFMEEAIMGVPVDERSLVKDDSGQDLTVGQTSGVGTMHAMSTEYGLHHEYSLSQKGSQFTWLSLHNREWMFWEVGQNPVELGHSFGFSKDMQKVFEDATLPGRDNIGEVITAFGIEKEIYLLPGNNQKGLVMDIQNKVYQGQRDLAISYAGWIAGLPLALHGNAFSVPRYGEYQYVDGVNVDSYITMVVNKQFDVLKFFDAFELKSQNIASLYFEADNGDNASYTIMSSLSSINRESGLRQYMSMLYGSVPFSSNYMQLKGTNIKVKLTAYKSQNIPAVFDFIKMNFRYE